MKIIDIDGGQGSQAWHQHRRAHRNASDAPAMMGCSPYKTRSELLREVHTGITADVAPDLQRRFDDGHRSEALARPLAEAIVGEDLYAIVKANGHLSASLDGETLMGDIDWEHKRLNSELRQAMPVLTDGGVGSPNVGKALPLHYRAQMEHQLHCSGAEKTLFTASEWDNDGALIDVRHCWYTADLALRAQIIDGWAQFERDLAAYALPAATEAATVGKAPDTLPALRIEVTGQVTASNLAEFKETALAAIRSVNRALTTDADFADAEKAVKWCGDVETRLAAAKEHALSQTATIDALFKAIDDISAEARRVRLDLDKLVARRKSEVRDEAVSRARAALDKHIATLNAEIAPMRLPTIAADFASAIKGKRSITSMQDALDGTMVAAKIAADNDARAIRSNLFAFKAKAAGFEFLFSDLSTLAHKPESDFCALVDARITTHKAAEAAKERQRQEAEQRRIDAAVRQAREEAERAAQQAAEQAQEAAAKALQQAAAPPPAPPAPVAPPAPILAPAEAAARILTARLPDAPRREEPATLNLGAICSRLGFTVTAQFLADTLHIQPARTDEAAKFYTESQFVGVCSRLQSHVAAMADLYAGETA